MARGNTDETSVQGSVLEARPAAIEAEASDPRRLGTREPLGDEGAEVGDGDAGLRAAVAAAHRTEGQRMDGAPLAHLLPTNRFGGGEVTLRPSFPWR